MSDVIDLRGIEYQKGLTANSLNLLTPSPYLSYKWDTGVEPVSKNRYLRDWGKTHNFKATMYSGRGVQFNGVDQSIHIGVTIGQFLYKFNIDTKQYIKENITFNGTYYLGKVGGTGDYETATYNNVIVSNIEFAEVEETYLYNNPEKFLYHEKQADGIFIAKSEILSQDKINAVVWHSPMCETDEYVRNMINYGIGSDIIAENTNGWSVVDGITLDTSSNIVTFDGTQKDYGACTRYHYPIPNSVYLITVEILEADDFINAGIRFGTASFKSFSSFGVKEIGNHSFLIMSDGNEKSYDRIWAKADWKGKVKIFSEQRANGFNQIINYTDSCRVKNITTGLQTCFWKRDALGVPVGSSFNELSFDGSGYVDTGYKVLYQESKQIELIVTKRTGDLSGYGAIVGDKSNYTALYVRFTPTHNSVVGINCNSYGYTELIISDISHIVISIYTDGYEVFLDGVSQGLKNTAGGTNDGSSLVLGRIDTTSQPLSGSIRLFNVHTTPQDPLELYNNAVKKGLLS